MNKKLTITLLGTLGICIIGTSSVLATTGNITAKAVRIREKADANANIITTISRGTEVEVEAQEDDWYKVKYDNKEGYIYKDYVSVIDLEDNTVETDQTSNEEEKTEENTNKDKEDTTLSNELCSDSKVYLTACYSSSKLGDIKNGTKIKIEKTISNWSYISSDEISGWIPNYKLIKANKDTSKEDNKKEENKDINKRAYLSTTVANIRKGPGTKYDTVGSISENETMTVLSEEDGWYKVKTQNNTTGYVLKTLVTLGEKKVTNRSNNLRDIETIKPEKKKTEKKKTTKKKTTKTTKVKDTKKEESKKEDNTNTSSADETRKALVAFAKKYLGYKYVHGGASPSTGFDCSGFTSYVYGHFGYKLSRASSAQGSHGTHVDKSKLKMGDLLIFTGHVGIYIGNGKFIHASNPRDGVKITKLSDSYYVRNYKDARRIIK